jgi:SulP family sulfate permease
VFFPRPNPYGGPAIRRDLIAGLTVGIILIPQAVAYGVLAGVPPVYGLYAALIPMVVYALTASSPHVNVGPTALASLLCLNGLSGLAEVGSSEFIGYAILLAAITGVVQLLFGLLRLGGLVSLLSRPVLSGFVSAAAILIITSQIRPLLGLDVPRTDHFHETVLLLFQSVPTLHSPTALLGAGTLILLFLGRWLFPRVPVLLGWIVIATALVYAFRWDLGGMAVVGTVPKGLPPLTLPSLDLTVWATLLPTALVLALISFIETLSIGKSLATHHAHYRIQPNRELFALGLSKIVGSLFGAIPTSASFSRSAVVEEGGGQSPLSSLVAAALLVLVLLFLTPLFFYLPLSMLAAVIIFSVSKLLDVAEMRRLARLAPRELAVLLVTLLFTLFAGLQYGIAGGVLLSLVFVYWRAARPHLAALGRIPGTNAFRNLDRFASAEERPDLLIVRFDAELYFGNAEFFGDRLLELVDAKGDALRHVILDAHTIHDVDTSGLYALEQFWESLRERNIDLYLSGVIGPVRDILFRAGLMDRFGTDRFFLSIQDAITYLSREDGRRDWNRPAVQHD